MNNLERRIGVLEEASGIRKMDVRGGLSPEVAAMLNTANEAVCAEAEEITNNPPPEVTLADLGEYGRQLVEEDGVSPAVAKHLEELHLDQ